jgi:hypothetical protein
MEGVAVVMAGQEKEIDEGQEHSPAKPKTKCPALGIGLVLKWLAGRMMVTYRGRRKRLLRWWQAKRKISTRGRSILLPN